MVAVIPCTMRSVPSGMVINHLPSAAVLFTVYNADIYPTHMVWGRYMDLIAAKEGGSTSSHWFDRFYVGTGLSRVVSRSSYSANAL